MTPPERVGLFLPNHDKLGNSIEPQFLAASQAAPSSQIVSVNPLANDTVGALAPLPLVDDATLRLPRPDQIDMDFRQKLGIEQAPFLVRRELRASS
jgi:hypothetical protein